MSNWLERQCLRVVFKYTAWQEQRKVRCLAPFAPPSGIGFRPEHTLVSIVRESDLSLLHFCLKSLYQNTSFLPSIVLVGDSPEAAAALRKHFSFLGEELSVFSGPDFVRKLDPNVQTFLKKWEEAKPYGGFARKFGPTMGLNRESAFVLIDADVLFFGDALPLLFKPERPSAMLASVDFRHSYDPKVNELLEGGDLFAETPINCGIIYHPHGCFAEHLKPEDWEKLEPLLNNVHPHLEQAIVGKVFLRSGGRCWDPQAVATHACDRAALFARNKCLIRHYAGVKNLFWRDAK